MKKFLAGILMVCALLMAFTSPAEENDYAVYLASDLSLSGTANTGTVVNTEYAVMEVFSIGCAITDTNSLVATNTITLKLVPYGQTAAYKVPGCPAQVEGSEAVTAISTNTVPVYLYRGDALQVIQSLANGTNALPNISASYHIKTGAKR
jgi:hypothetical protein